MAESFNAKIKLFRAKKVVSGINIGWDSNQQRPPVWEAVV